VTVILELDLMQVSMPQRDNRSRPRVMRVGLVLAARVQQPRSGRERGRHINNRLARRNQLLGEQRTMTRRAFDRPHARFER
jgi:hypothetical protein